jgi:hypothetical protein
MLKFLAVEERDRVRPMSATYDSANRMTKVTLNAGAGPKTYGLGRGGRAVRISKAMWISGQEPSLANTLRRSYLRGSTSAALN